MTSYFLKSVLCSGILLLFYHLFLENEKMFRFNRFYLLASIVFSLIVPLISIELEANTIVESAPIFNTTENLSDRIPFRLKKALEETDLNWSEFLPVAIYTIVAIILLIRLTRNLFSIFSKRKNQLTISYEGARLVLLDEHTITYTFLNLIFVNKTDFKANRIEKEVLTDELAHVRQKHSLDVLFLELVKGLFWINPMFLLYKKAIQTNHEFLADATVLSAYSNMKDYQLLLLDKIAYQRHINLASSFSYSITKKRLAIMTKNTSFRIICLKQAGISILVTCMTFFFATKKIVAHNKEIEREKPSSAAQKEGVTSKQFEEYEATIKKMLTTRIGRDGEKYTSYSMMDNGLLKRADVIYRFMSEEQKKNATKVQFIPMLPVPEITRPTQEQLDEWLNAKQFGVWLDERRISNADLKKYKPSDFSYYFISKLEKNAINYGKHYFQIGLSTSKTFEAWQETRTPLIVIPD